MPAITYVAAHAAPRVRSVKRANVALGADAKSTVTLARVRRAFVAVDGGAASTVTLARVTRAFVALDDRADSKVTLAPGNIRRGRDIARAARDELARAVEPPRRR